MRPEGKRRFARGSAVTTALASMRYRVFHPGLSPTPIGGGGPSIRAIADAVAREAAAAGPDEEVRMEVEGDRVRVGVSSCLLGAAVRYDGGHKRHAWITGPLSRCFELVPVCPEVAIGLGTPRPPIRLVRTGGEVRVRGVADPSRDLTCALRDYARSTAARLAGGISGYLFKSASPSCGMEGVEACDESGAPAGWGAGAYAGALRSAMPLLPCEEEGRLGDPGRRESFVERVFVFHRWQKLERSGLTPARLVEFHTAHESLVLAHDEAAGRRMGRLVARAGEPGLEALAAEYARELMGALERRATPSRFGQGTCTWIPACAGMTEGARE